MESNEFQITSEKMENSTFALALYVRRYVFDPENKCIVIIAKFISENKLNAVVLFWIS